MVLYLDDARPQSSYHQVNVQLDEVCTMSPTRVLIVDDQAFFRRYLRQLLTQAGLTVVGEAKDMPEARQLVHTLQPDLAVVDLCLPGESGVSGTPQLIALAPKMRVILISANQDRAQILQKSAVEAGAETFISKDDLELELLQHWADVGPAGKEETKAARP